MAFDYVILCVKALPDVYNLADIIQSVVTKQHTCILVNTTNTLGVEKELEKRFPTNVVLSLVSGADLTQLGSSEFEHSGSTDLWVGPANINSEIPEAIQNDMSEALAMTLTTGQVDCQVSTNIRQQQYERMIGLVNTFPHSCLQQLTTRSPIAFHPTSVLFETSSHAELLQKPGVRDIIEDVIQELVSLATAHQCTFPSDFTSKTIQAMMAATEPSTMYQDFTARRPMEVETYLGSPVQLARTAGVKVPRLETLYAMMRHINSTNKDRTPPASSPAIPQSGPPPQMGQPPPRGASMQPPPRGPMPGPRQRGPNMGGSMGPPGRRGPPPVNGFRGYPPPPNGMQRRPSMDENNLDEFSHVVLYDDLPDGDFAEGGPPAGGLSVRERELMLRERELQLKQQEMAMRSRGPRRPSHNRHQDFDEDDDDDEFIDPMVPRYPQPPMDDNFDMMSVTSRRTKRAPSQGQLRKDMFGGGPPMRGGYNPRPYMNRNRTSSQLMSDMPTMGGNILDNPMMGFSSNRYGTVDRKEIHNESRTNSLTAARLNEMGGGGGGPYPGPPSRRTSRSPGNPFGPGPMGRPQGRPSPPHDYGSNGPRNGRPSPPGGMPAPVPRYPPGQGNSVHPHQVEQQAGVSKPHPPKVPAKSLTGSASASAGSGDSGSANIESEPSAHSSQSSFAPRPMMNMAH